MWKFKKKIDSLCLFMFLTVKFAVQFAPWLAFIMIFAGMMSFISINASYAIISIGGLLCILKGWADWYYEHE